MVLYLCEIQLAIDGNHVYVLDEITNNVEKQMELALAYGCSDSVDSETLVEYIHHNRDLNARQIKTFGDAQIDHMKSIKFANMYDQGSTVN